MQTEHVPFAFEAKRDGTIIICKNDTLLLSYLNIINDLYIVQCYYRINTFLISILIHPIIHYFI